MIGNIWTEGGIAMLSELCQIQKDKYRLFFFLCGIQIKRKKDGAEPMVRFVKHLLYQHEDLDSVSSTHEQTGHLWQQLERDATDYVVCKQQNSLFQFWTLRRSR